MEQTTIIAVAPAFASFRCDPADLARAVKFLNSKVVERRNTVPIAACVRIVAEIDGALIITATDYDQSVSVTLSANVDAPGAFCTDAATLSDMLGKVSKTMRGKLLQMVDLGGPAVQVSCGEAAFNLRSLPADDFLTIDMADRKALSRFMVPAERFVADMTALAPCMSSNEQRYYLNGVAFEAREMAGQPRLVMAAIDGDALAVASRPIPAGAEGLASCILPRKAVATIIAAARLVGDVEAASFEHCQDHGGRFAITLGNVQIHTKAIDGAFPQWEGCFEGKLALADDDGQAMFPDLLPGVPTPRLEKLRKAAGAPIEWLEAVGGKVGVLANDPHMIFGLAFSEDSALGRGLTYDASVTATVDGDPTVYRIPTASAGTIALSKEQVRAMVGESCFITFAVLIGGTVHHVLQWLWDDGASRFLTVREDGRCFPGGVLLTRAEIETALAAGLDMAEDRPETAQGAQEPVEPVAVEPAARIDADSAPIAVSDPIAELTARVAAMEARLAALSAHAESPAMHKTGAIVHNATPIVHKRTPTHERAIRRAWLERAERRRAAAMAADFQRIAERQERANDAEYKLWREERARLQATIDEYKGAVADLSKERDILFEQVCAAGRANGRERRKRLASAGRARRLIAIARQATLSGQRDASRAQQTLSRLQRDRSDPTTPDRASDVARLLRERDEARNANAAIAARAERAERAVADLADRFEAMGTRLAIAESKARRLAA